ncbi:hypothetical protein [Natrarchaeobaculum aegyptiacum]|uniref:DUF7974 domain-containing protein n=1 Tax=Natrarchaeobaculum aegyptiacum TaxID=745377 RepID=A0A2Z2HPH9_9EURY|nr:hypothetical protein [Natrarchaeobaculum aegyptiacum]ARS88930.1 hypothetical protein B1756_03620 [Natrarchaeobaculum aegyptiacum]
MPSPSTGADPVDRQERSRERERPDRSRTVDFGALSHAFLPERLRTRAITVTIETDRDCYRTGESVTLTVTLENRLPIPVRLRTESPVGWHWSVDGHPEGSAVARPASDRTGVISFARGERKRFRRRWPQRVRVSDHEWDAADPGRHTLEARIDRPDADARGLVDRTTLEIVA